MPLRAIPGLEDPASKLRVDGTDTHNVIDTHNHLQAEYDYYLEGINHEVNVLVSLSATPPKDDKSAERKQTQKAQACVEKVLIALSGATTLLAGREQYASGKTRLDVGGDFFQAFSFYRYTRLAASVCLVAEMCRVAQKGAAATRMTVQDQRLLACAQELLKLKDRMASAELGIELSAINDAEKEMVEMMRSQLRNGSEFVSPLGIRIETDAAGGTMLSYVDASSAPAENVSPPPASPRSVDPAPADQRAAASRQEALDRATMAAAPPKSRGGSPPKSETTTPTAAPASKSGGFFSVKNLNVILLGPPAAGKGAVTDAIKAEFPEMSSVSTGDLLRAAVESLNNGTAGARNSKLKSVAETAAAHMKKGELVPDSVASDLLKSHLVEHVESKQVQQVLKFGTNSAVIRGFIFDGYPRTTAQAETLEKILTDVAKKTGEGDSNVADHTKTVIIELEVPDARLTERICGRWVHKQSGRTYHVSSKPPKSYVAYLKTVGGSEKPKPTEKNMLDDVTNEPLYQRADDTEAALKNRLETFHSQTSNIKSFYRAATSHHYCSVNGDQSPAKVGAAVVGILRNDLLALGSTSNKRSPASGSGGSRVEKMNSLDITPGSGAELGSKSYAVPRSQNSVQAAGGRNVKPKPELVRPEQDVDLQKKLNAPVVYNFQLPPKEERRGWQPPPPPEVKPVVRNFALPPKEERKGWQPPAAADETAEKPVKRNFEIKRTNSMEQQKYLQQAADDYPSSDPPWKKLQGPGVIKVTVPKSEPGSKAKAFKKNANGAWERRATGDGDDGDEMTGKEGDDDRPKDFFGKPAPKEKKVFKQDPKTGKWLAMSAEEAAAAAAEEARQNANRSSDDGPRDVFGKKIPEKKKVFKQDPKSGRWIAIDAEEARREQERLDKESYEALQREKKRPKDYFGKPFPKEKKVFKQDPRTGKWLEEVVEVRESASEQMPEGLLSSVRPLEQSGMYFATEDPFSSRGPSSVQLQPQSILLGTTTFGRGGSVADNVVLEAKPLKGFASGGSKASRGSNGSRGSAAEKARGAEGSAGKYNLPSSGYEATDDEGEEGKPGSRDNATIPKLPSVNVKETPRSKAPPTSVGSVDGVLKSGMSSLGETLDIDALMNGELRLMNSAGGWSEDSELAALLDGMG